MSKKAMSDSERTAIMLDLVRRCHELEDDDRRMSLSTIVLEEVAPGTGFYGAVRWADVLALGVWKSTGRYLRGYEIKASKADLKKELGDPTKHEAVARYCDFWTLVAWDESVLVEGVPEGWGICLTRVGSDGVRELVEQRKPTKRSPEPWPRDFVCSMVRNAYEQAPGAAFVARAVMAAKQRAQSDSDRNIDRAVREALRPLTEHYYGPNTWTWKREKVEPAALIARAVADLKQDSLFAPDAPNVLPALKSL